MRKKLIYIFLFLASLSIILIPNKEAKADTIFNPDDYDLNSYNLYALDMSGVEEDYLLQLLEDYGIVYIEGDYLYIFDNSYLLYDGPEQATYSGIELVMEFRIYTTRNDWIDYRTTFEADIIFSGGYPHFESPVIFQNEIDTSYIDMDNPDCLYIFNDNLTMMYCPVFGVAEYLLHCYFWVESPEGRFIDSAVEDFSDLDVYSLEDMSGLASDIFNPELIKELELYDLANVINAIEIADRLAYTRGYNKALEETPDVQEAYQNGYNEGYATASALSGGMDFFTGIFTSLGAFFSIQLLPNITFGMIVGIPFLISFVWFVIKNMRGGS